MNIIVTGVEKSGTGLVAKLLRDAGENVEHRAVPHIHDYYPLLNLTQADHVVFVTRHAPCQERSQANNSIHVHVVPRAFLHAASFSLKEGVPLTIWTYEAIIHEWPRSFELAAKDLGIDVADIMRSVVKNRAFIRDENEKYYERLSRP